MGRSLPETVTVGPWVLNITRDDKKLYDKSQHFPSTLAAFCSVTEGSIVLREDETVSDDQLAIDLLHEVLHACLLSVDFTEGNEAIEHIIETLALSLIPVIKYNPEFVYFLAGVEDEN